jgi:hypothetical protein
MKGIRVVLIGLVALMGCQAPAPNAQSNATPSIAVSPTTTASPTTLPSSPTPASSPTNTPSPSSAGRQPSPVSAEFLISTQGIGPAKVGMTLQELKQALGASARFQVVRDFMVDIDAIAIYQSGQVQYYIFYPSGTTFADTDKIGLLSTDNTKYRTAEGVGPGTTLQQAQAIYGQTLLSYNTDDESREYVQFANFPWKNITFRPILSASALGFAGVYPSSSTAYNETKIFKETAIIKSIVVSNRGKNQ